ncbi:hypothetical protein EXIGLDRAFT_750758 [Exidia glandulosa HHB12029]|uniref:Uncharacterized protein n=1 Tax=Exidia glandulosa HHB12029 TaxID=1314781 RepID=A0A166AAR3_EXIGL|nr:hypothetical protein EXIGLDRAFT_750758 [Exidia glandulosa HHB12029]
MLSSGSSFISVLGYRDPGVHRESVVKLNDQVDDLSPADTESPNQTALYERGDLLPEVTYTIQIDYSGSGVLTMAGVILSPEAQALQLPPPSSSTPLPERTNTPTQVVAPTVAARIEYQFNDFTLYGCCGLGRLDYGRLALTFEPTELPIIEGFLPYSARFPYCGAGEVAISVRSSLHIHYSRPPQQMEGILYATRKSGASEGQPISSVLWMNRRRKCFRDQHLNHISTTTVKDTFHLMWSCHLPFEERRLR